MPWLRKGAVGWWRRTEKGRRNKPDLEACCRRFRAALEEERRRTERNGHSLAVILFKIPSGRLDEGDSLLQRLGQRIRATDKSGWYDEGHIGVLLPYTPYCGALKLAQEVQQSLEEYSPAFEIWTFPSAPGQSAGPARPGKPLGPFRDPLPDSFPGPPVPETPVPLWKRSLDLTVATAALVLLAPLFGLIAAGIRLSSPGPILFRQQRIGYLGRPFVLFKFRTMKVKTDEAPHRQYVRQLVNADVAMEKLDDRKDPRITPFGRLLRRSCLDELPQLFNVLRGEMSLVGPRPCLPYEAQEFSPWHCRRFRSVPGLTGLWQVSGKNRTTFREMIRLDIRYETRCSFWTDLWILIKTVPAVLRG